MSPGEFLEEPSGFSAIRRTCAGNCLFYDPSEHLCTIQVCKPWDCRAFPGQLVRTRGGELAWVIYRWCPLVSAGLFCNPEVLEPLEAEISEMLAAGEVWLDEYVSDGPLPEARCGLIEIRCGAGVARWPNGGVDC
jgi:Fe-S-cluster containining protein